VIAAVAGAISAPRLAPYLTQTGSNTRQAVRLYQWNIELSGAVYELLHGFEVVLRNAMDAQLCAWNCEQRRPDGQQHHRDWLMEPAPLLVRLTRGGKDINEAKRRAEQASRRRRGDGRGRPVAHADVLANLSLGTWRYLLPDKDAGRQRLWADALVGAFPHLQTTPDDLLRAVKGVHELRNRVAHLEPLLDVRNVYRQVQNVRQVLAAIEPHTEQWAMGWQRVTTVLAARP
jgi:hypothetical protein